jgi:hypothetical protein
MPVPSKHLPSSRAQKNFCEATRQTLKLAGVHASFSVDLTQSTLSNRVLYTNQTEAAMPISPTEAKHTLQDISKAGSASARFYGYRVASPHLILWGVIWALGYGANYFSPSQVLIWPVLVLIGISGSSWLGWKAGRSSVSPGGWRYAATALVAALFVAAVFAVMPPRTEAQVSAFFPIFVAFSYGVMGIWTGGLRLIVTAALIAALTLVAFFWLPDIFTLWMAMVGGGALILGGIWFRKA